MVMPARIWSNLKIQMETIDKIETIIYCKVGRTDCILLVQIYNKNKKMQGFDWGTNVTLLGKPKLITLANVL